MMAAAAAAAEEEEERLCRQVDGLRAELDAMRRRYVRVATTSGHTAIDEPLSA